MLVSRNTHNFSIGLILLSTLMCTPHLPAQQQSEETGATENRRIERLGEGNADEWEMDLRLPSAAPAASSGFGEFALPNDEQNKELQRLLSKLASNPGDNQVLAQLNTLLADVLVQADTLMDAGSFDESENLLSLIQSIDPGMSGFRSAKNRLQTLKETDELLKAGDSALVSGQVLEPESGSAFYFYGRALAKDPQSDSAKKGLERVQNSLIDRALELARELDFESAEIQLLEAAEVWGDQKPVEDARIEVSEFKQGRAADLEQKVVDAMNSGEFDLADFAIIDMMALGGQSRQVKTLLARLEEAKFYGGFEPGQIISDELQSGGQSPEIVIIDAGSFLMGSRESAGKARDHEKPLHRVIIKRGFGLGLKEVTVAQFQLFVSRTGYRTAAEISGGSSVYDETAGRLSKKNGVFWKHDFKGKKAAPDLPVLHVNAYDAQAYAQWLTVETGKNYRLPSEAEYEYAAKAGGNSTYWWGENSPSEVVENLTGERDKLSNKRQWATFFKKYGDGHWGPAPVGSLVGDSLIHPMGLFDIAGNVSEWMADCWHQNYVKAPTNGSAWFNPGCDRRVVRGGYWASAPEQTRAAFRFPVKAQSYGPVIGFRIARSL